MMAIPLAISAVATIANAAEQSKLSNQQADTASKVAQYNAGLDRQQAQQLGMDSAANIQKQRQDDSVYLSGQRAAYAASGVLSGTGSPLAVQATTAGRMEQDINQYWTDTQIKEQNLYKAAEMGIYQGQQQSEAYHLQGTAAIFQGIGGVANVVGTGIRAGVFDTGSTSGIGSSYTNPTASDFSHGG